MGWPQRKARCDENESKTFEQSKIAAMMLRRL
jgi:hypothetical protein